MPDQSTFTHVSRAHRDRRVSNPEVLAQKIESRHTWEHIVLPDDLWAQLRELVNQVLVRDTVYDAWGFGDRSSRGRGISALFVGGSGTGKTMAAEALANHLDLDLCRVDLPQVVSKYIGETEKNLQKVFEAAEQAMAVLLFDEADALFGKRTEIRDSHDRYANLVVTYLLQRMEDHSGIVVLETNRKASIDPAFLRHLKFILEFPFPDPASRRRIWGKVFPERAPLQGLDCNALAQLDVAGGTIRNIAVSAGCLAASEDTPIRMKHLAHAARRECVEMDGLSVDSGLRRHDVKTR